MVGVLVWFVIFIGLIVLEILTADVLTVWFMPGALICVILASLDIGVPIQIAVFFLLSGIMLVLSKTVFKKYLVKGKKEKTNIDLIIGEIGIVTEDIDNVEAKGAVKVHFQLWTARSADSAVLIKAGERVKIKAVEGVKLICEKIDN